MPRAGLSAARVTDVAARLADAHGLEALSLAAVAQEVGVRLPSLYNHVAGLGGMKRALALRACEVLRAALTDAIAGRSGAAALSAAACAYRRWAHAHPGLYAAVQLAPADGDVEHAEAATRVVHVLGSLWRDRAFDDDAVHALRIVRAALHGFVQLELAGGFGFPLDAEVTFDRLVAVLAVGTGLGDAPDGAPDSGPAGGLAVHPAPAAPRRRARR